MKDISELNVSETRIFGADFIPFRHLITASKLPLFTNAFLFKDTELVQDQNTNSLHSLKMKLGEFKYKDQIFPIDQLSIDRRTIAFLIYGDSEIAEQFYLSVSKILSEIDPNKKYGSDKYIIKTAITSCVANLDFDFEDIISAKFVSFIKKEVSTVIASAIDKKLKVQLAPRGISFNVNYTIEDESLLENNIGVASKQFTIEPRIGTNPRDRLYFTSSPTDSKAHLDLLREFEKIFKKTNKHKEVSSD